MRRLRRKRRYAEFAGNAGETGKDKPAKSDYSETETGNRQEKLRLNNK
jgi:hypothetical protein